jgi:hypothetical protein
MNNKIQVRRYQDGDAKFLSQIYYNTIHTVNAKDYTKEQLDAWAPWSSVQDYSGWQEKLEKIKPFVVLIDDKIVGFAEFEPNGHIDCFYQIARKTPSLLGRGYKRVVAKQQPSVEFSAVQHIV